LYGNLLSSIGKAHINYYIASFALIINVTANFYLIPKYGLKGAAITTATLMWITGIISLVWFLILYKKLLSQQS
jgi:O-antigen/teichoic acid export membrane protein